MGSCSKVSGGSYMKKGGNMYGSKLGGTGHEEKKGGNMCGSKVGGTGHEEKKGGNMCGSKVGGSYHEEKKGGIGCGSRKKRGGEQYDEGSFKSASEGPTSTLSSSDETKTPKEASQYMGMGGKKRRKRKTKRVKKVRRKTAKKSFLARLFKL